MRRLVLLILFASNTLFAAGSPDLLVAVRNGDHAQVRKLLEAGADVNTADRDGATALMHSVIESDVEMMKLLINRGANVNAANSAGSTALMYAATNLAKTRVLLDAGANVQLKGKYGSPMSVAVTTFGSTPVLKLLVAKGAELEPRLVAGAAAMGDLEALQYLLSAGVPSSGLTGAAISSAITSRCEACVRLLIEKGAPANGVRPNGTLSSTVGATSGGVLNDTVKRAMPELSQFLLDHGASLESRDREGFTLLQQAVLSMEPPPARDRMVEWLLSKGVDPNAKNDRGDTAYALAARVGLTSTLDILKKAGAKETTEEWPKPAGNALSPDAAVKKVIHTIEMSGEPGWKARQCVSCHSNSLPAMTVALARKKGFMVNEAQAKKELGFAIETDEPVLEPNRLGASPIGGGTDTLGYTLMGMAAAGAPADSLTDAHVHFMSLNQYPDGAFRNSSYRPPSEYGPFTTTALALRSIKLYPIPGRREEFQERVSRAKKWLLSAKPYSTEQRSMQLNGLGDAGASASERAPFVKGLMAAQNPDGSWSQVPGTRADAYATGQALYALHVSGNVPVNDPVYQKGVQWLLRNQLPDGSWFAPTRAVPVQPHTFESFPNGWHQFASDAASCWSTMALLFTLPDKTGASN
jgi:ankyrin repeat protein